MVTRKQRKKSNAPSTWLKFISISSTSKPKNVTFINCLLVIATVLTISIYWNSTTSTIPVSGSANYIRHLPDLWPQGKQVLFWGVPGLAEVSHQQIQVKITPKQSAGKFSHRLLLLLSNIDLGDWRSLLTQEIPFMLINKKAETPVVSAALLPNFPKFEAGTLKIKDKVLVGIYHTHTAESFIANSGVSHRPGGQRGDILEVGGALAQQLEAAGVKALHSQTIHDYPSFMKAYGPSEATALKMISDNPTLQMIFDIHRDAEKRENVTAIINNMQIAKITIVVATGQEDLPQPHWQQNHAFAKLVEAKLNAKYPGLCRGIQLVEWRYNQHLHPRALLLEVGSQESSKEEAIRSMQLMADILVEILQESQ